MISLHCWVCFQKSVYIAQYSYVVQEDAEVDFSTDDRIIDPELIDEGWMIGTVEKTGKRGLLPSNCVAIETSTESKTR